MLSRIDNVLEMTQVKKAPVHSAAKRILCVEDDKDTCDYLSFLFRDYDFIFTNKKADAEKIVEEQEFNLFILDNWLPDGNGIELCRKIRGLNPDTPILFTSAVGLKNDIEAAAAAGANRYLLKPCDPDMLQKTVKELLDAEART